MKSRLLTLLLPLLWATTLFNAPALYADDEDPVYTLARAPQRSVVTTIRNWQPLIDYLNRETGYQFRLKVFPSRAEFESSLLQGELDLIYMSPFYHSVVHKKHGYIPLIRSSKSLQGILVVHRNGRAQTLRDIHKGTLAFPSPNAFAASLYMRALLHEQENIDFTPNYVETHDNVYRNVLFGKAIAGGGVMRTLNQEPAALRQQLRIIYTTPKSAPHPLSAHPRISTNVREAVTQAILKLQNTDTGKALLGRIKLQQPMLADQQRDYDALGELGLDKYTTIAP